MTHLDFVGKRKGFIILSAILIIAAIILSFTKSFDFGIEFTGGTEITASIEEEKTIDELRTILSEIDQDYSTAKIVELNPIEGQEDRYFFALTINRSFENVEQKESFESQLRSKLGENNLEILQLNDVSGYAADQIKSFAWYAVSIVLVLLLAYITLRFKFAYGLGALLALAHDIIIVLGFYSLFGIEINVTALAALLTLAGYSLNDTIVVYDRIRENLKAMRGKPIENIVNQSLNDVIVRSINTSLTTFIIVFLMLIIGGRAIAPFAFGLTIGVIVGTYSSLYIASPLVIGMLKRQNNY
ncbi:protein translocase subunit SecF [Geotoga petraea]|uniref:Protein-export membrane protein SecF n=1 Tax=Geotoga petraea TaxID=28234 RepID=A0A1G6LYI3_9BACT|nr:protein translocase subunit SecF [Geotoga petraea]SDC48279.1 preprotein translocase subunit SecF [Geotoga petraea]